MDRQKFCVCQIEVLWVVLKPVWGLSLNTSTKVRIYHWKFFGIVIYFNLTSYAIANINNMMVLHFQIFVYIVWSILYFLSNQITLKLFTSPHNQSARLLNRWLYFYVNMSLFFNHIMFKLYSVLWIYA